MSLSIAAVTMDCQDAEVVGTFWSAALGRPLVDQPPVSPFFTRIEGDESGPTMMFIKVPEGRAVKNRVHLDLSADDRATEIARLVALGASQGNSYEEWGTAWTTLHDPEGNEFCVAEHG